MEQHITSEEWEKDFDKDCPDYQGNGSPVMIQRDDAKAFIRSLLQAQQQKFRETLEGLKIDTKIDIKGTHSLLLKESFDHFNKCIDRALSQVDQSQ